jgi:hypothetical protein
MNHGGKVDNAYLGIGLHHLYRIKQVVSGALALPVVLDHKDIFAVAMAEAVIVISAQSCVFWRQREHIRWECPYLRLNLWTTPVVGDDQLEIRVGGVSPKAFHSLLQKVKAFVRNE